MKRFFLLTAALAALSSQSALARPHLLARLRGQSCPTPVAAAPVPCQSAPVPFVQSRPVVAAAGQFVQAVGNTGHAVGHVVQAAANVPASLVYQVGQQLGGCANGRCPLPGR